LSVDSSSLLPNPRDLEKISLMYGLNKLFTSKKLPDGTGFSLNNAISRLKTGHIVLPSSPMFDEFNLFFLNRSMHQANEACNKLWSTVEIHYNIENNENICKKFSCDFLPSSTVPTLHYANMSALLSILSLFGLSSVVDRKRGMTFYNIVRTKNGVILMERSKYLRSLFGSAKSGWHAQVIQTYDGLMNMGVDLPFIDIGNTKKLQTARAKFHYDILGQTNMKGFPGVQTYFQLLPIVVQSICLSIASIHKIIKPIPNGVDGRFKELNSKINQWKKSRSGC
jgi:hypothetical protein